MCEPDTVFNVCLLRCGQLTCSMAMALFWCVPLCRSFDLWDIFEHDQQQRGTSREAACLLYLRLSLSSTVHRRKHTLMLTPFPTVQL
ncbi:hypothetical protein F4778DRAFT_723860 [Xylariomycetidae sp. FL2044]|nr:hypothetical protein F4778DRAFT_723860 [Xylariomycetidae sp. FL2044]